VGDYWKSIPNYEDRAHRGGKKCGPWHRTYGGKKESDG
ncbi:hypothetical protein MPER_01666, partial [Moniliophthora perniciosa FA553]